ncbi:uncharacterized protein [Littorina saxatilis]|uniref:Uncharacterized protein n=1 Tax=Littorina saxatilis TaxID=31220 RepID=A0AAN9ATI5_9CAEN
METQGHKGWFMALVIVSLLIQLLVYFFNAAQPDFIKGIFKNTVGNQSDKYALEITPSGWTFSIWGFIYAWQAVWVFYSLVNLCRRTHEGPVYLCPAILPPALFVTFILANICNITWLFVFDNDIIEAAFVSLGGIAVFLILGLVVSYRALDAASPKLVEQKRTVDIWLVRGFVHNGLGIYATWCCIATLLNLAMVIRYRSDPVISTEDACTVALAVLSAEIVVFAITDLFVLDRYTRYTLTPYIVVVVALIGSIDKNWEDGARNSIFTAVLLGMGAAALVLKIVMLLYRHCTRTPYTSHFAPTLDGYNKGGQLA